MILAACKRGVAAVVVTHDAQLASWADRVVFLRDGRVVDQTAPPPDPSPCSRPGDRMSHSPAVASRPARRAVTAARRPAGGRPLGLAAVPP